MKPHCARCQEILDQVAECLEDLHSEDETKRLAGMLGFAAILSPDYEPLEDGRWTNTKESEVEA